MHYYRVMRNRMLVISGLLSLIAAGALFGQNVAFPVKATAPVVYTCPQPNLLAFGTNESVPLQRTDARMNGSTLVCGYKLAGEITLKASGRGSCPQPPAVSVVGAPGTTTDTGQGCGQHGLAWCHGPALNFTGLTSDGPPSNGVCKYSGGSVELFTTVPQGTCFNGSGKDTAGGHSPTGSFLCW